MKGVRAFLGQLARPFAGFLAAARPANRRNRRKDTERRRLRLPRIAWRRVATMAATLVLLLGAAFGVRASLDQPIESIAVEGRFQRVARADVERAVIAHTRGKGLIAIDLAAVRAAVRAIPWVDEANVRRSWPRGLAIFVVEQTPVARWGESGLLNIRGEIFTNDARHIPPELPELAGPPGTEGEVTARYLASQGKLIEAGLRLSSLRFDERGAWEMKLDSGVVVRLGRRQVDERFARFVVAAARLVAQRAAEIAYVDLRYTNGFAVGWRTRQGSNQGTSGGAPHA